MTCTDFESVLADYIDGTLSNAERASVEQHVASCPVCREFLAEVTDGVSFLELGGSRPIEPPGELITRIAYAAPLGKALRPYEKQGRFGVLFAKWVLPILQPRLAMGMAMTVLSFAMLERCTGVRVQRIQPADLNPVRVWGGVEDKAMRVKDQVVKYYDNLKIVYEIESRLHDLQEQQDVPDYSTRSGGGNSAKSKTSSGGQSRSDKGRSSGPALEQGNKP